MKYNLSLLKDVFKKKIYKFYVIELVFIMLCFVLRSDENLLEIVLGLNEIKLLDFILDIVRIINVIVILYVTFSIYFYDFYKNPEFVILRKKEKLYYLNKIIYIFIFIFILKCINVILFMLINHNISFSILLYGIINNIYISSLGITLINSYSKNNYLVLALSTILIFVNLFYIVDSIIIKIILFVIVNLYNYISFNYHEIYNKII